MTADQIIDLLDLKPHPEGGFFKETYRSHGQILKSSTGQHERLFSTAIYYMLTPGTLSKFHRLSSDEVFHFYMGDPVTWVLLGAGGRKRKIVLGNDLSGGQEIQMVVPAGTWFGGYLNEGGRYALMGTTVAPGFEFSDFVMARREELLMLYPSSEADILKLT